MTPELFQQAKELMGKIAYERSKVEYLSKALEKVNSFDADSDFNLSLNGVMNVVRLPRICIAEAIDAEIERTKKELARLLTKFEAL